MLELDLNFKFDILRKWMLLNGKH